MTNTPPPGRTRDDLIGLAVVLTIVALSLIFFPFMRDIAATPFIFIRDSIVFVGETIFSTLGSLL